MKGNSRIPLCFMYNIYIGNFMDFSLRLGHSVLKFEAEHSQIIGFFKDFIVESAECMNVIRVGTYEVDQYLQQFPGSAWDAYAEYKCLLNLASDAMMNQQQFLFHSAAIIIDNQVWLLSGPSGIGKSTQYRNLKTIYGDRIGVVSGDYPVLVFEDDSIAVFPSPWNGKENWGSMDTGKLAGIILLKQSRVNRFSTLSAEEAVVPVYKQINTYAKTEEQIHLVADLEERLITSVPVWSFENTGDLESSRILYEHILNERRAG